MTITNYDLHAFYSSDAIKLATHAEFRALAERTVQEQLNRQVDHKRVFAVADEEQPFFCHLRLLHHHRAGADYRRTGVVSGGFAGAMARCTTVGSTC